jgi:hypothetical protein
MFFVNIIIRLNQTYKSILGKVPEKVEQLEQCKNLVSITPK